MDKAATDHVLKIVRLLAKGADHSRLSSTQVNILNQNVDALIAYEGDQFVCRFLAVVRDATAVLTPNVGGKLTKYP